MPKYYLFPLGLILSLVLIACGGVAVGPATIPILAEPTKSSITQSDKVHSLVPTWTSTPMALSAVTLAIQTTPTVTVPTTMPIVPQSQFPLITLPTPIARFNVPVSRLGKQSVHWVTLSNTHLYWVGDADPGHLWRAPRTGGKPELVATSLFSQGHLNVMEPRQQGEWLVFIDAQNLSLGTPYLFRALNTVNHTEKLLIDGRDHQTDMPEFSIEGDLLVWTTVVTTHDPNCNQTIFNLHNLTTDQDHELERTCIEDQHLWSLPVLSGKFVVAEQDLPDSKGGGSNIYLYDLKTNQFTALTTDGHSSSPTISGPWIAWKNGPRYEEVKTTMLYNQQTQARQILAMGRDWVYLANQRWLYWAPWGGSPIQVYDLVNQQFMTVAISGAQDLVTSPIIFDDTIAWVRIPDSATEKFGDTLEWRQLP